MPEKINLGQIEVLELVNTTPPYMMDYVGIGQTVAFDAVYVGGYTHITGYVYSDVASATDGVVIEQAQTADLFAVGAVTTTGITSSTMTYSAADITSNALSVQIVAPFARIVYVNGGAGQGAFNIFFCARTIRGL